MTPVVRAHWHWVRHAPVVAAVGVYGNDNPPADCSDAATFRWLGEVLPRTGVVVSSPLQRARQTAQQVASMLPASGDSQDFAEMLNTPVLENRFREFGYGHWQGMTWDEVQESFPEEAGQYFAANPWVAPPGAESFMAYTARVGAAIVEVSHRYAGQNIICFAHAGTITAALMQGMGVGGAPSSVGMGLRLRNCSVTTIELQFTEAGLLGQVWGIGQLPTLYCVDNHPQKG